MSAPRYCLPSPLRFFFNRPATPEISTLSLHDALPICRTARRHRRAAGRAGRQAEIIAMTASVFIDGGAGTTGLEITDRDRKSTRLNSSHVEISYAVFCLKKKKTKQHNNTPHHKRPSTA